MLIKPTASIKTQLVYWFCFLALVPALLLTIITLLLAVYNIKDVVKHDLRTSSEETAYFVERWFASRKQDVNFQASLPQNVTLLTHLNSAFSQSGTDLKTFTKSEVWRDIVAKHASVLNVWQAKYQYIYDVFLIDTTGNIVFSVALETDLGTNLFDGPFADTLFANTVRKSIASTTATFSDFERYVPSGNIVSGFFSTPMVNEQGQVIGVFAMQMRPDIITTLLEQKYRGYKSYIVGDDGYLRTAIENDDDRQVLAHRVTQGQSEDLFESLKASSSNALMADAYEDVFGNQVIGYWQKIPAMNQAWYLVSEIDHSFAYGRIGPLNVIVLFVLLVILVICVFLAVFVGRRIARPLIELTEAMRAVRQGDRQVSISLNGEGEIAELSNSFNLMVKSRWHYEEQLETRNQEVRKILSELEEQRQALSHHAIVAITDIKGTITYVNSKFCDLSEYNEHELIGKNHRLLNSGFHDKDFFRNMYLSISKGVVWQGEICNRSRSGRLYWVATTIVPTRDESGKISSYIAIRTDITAQKYMVAELSEANQKAQAANNAKSEFLACMSHEIRTPMNAILGMLTLLQKTTLANDQRRKLDIAYESSKSLLGIINDILDFSKIDAGKLEVESIEFDVVTMFANIASVMNIKAENEKVDLLLDTQGITHPIIIGDPNRLRQIITNLLGNALKFTERGQVVVSARTHEREGLVELICEVRDTGIGIAEDKLPHLFEAFSQADATTTRRFGGTGLGLTIVRQLCHLMGGEVSASSELGVGSTFRFHVSCGAATVKVANTRFDEKNVLVIEPNAEAAEMFYDLLTQSGANVVVVSNFEEGAALLCPVVNSANQSPESPHSLAAYFDVVLVSLTPVQPISVLMDRIASDAKARQVPMLCLACSSCAQAVEAYRGSSQIRGVLHKPTPSQYLIRALEQVLVRSTTDWISDGAWTEGLAKSNQGINAVALFSGMNVLLVEDNPINQEVATELLEDFGISVAIANNGQEAIDYLNRNALPHLVLMDCQMPVKDGFSTTEAIRQGEAGVEASQIPIIAMTANAMAGDRERCLRAGMNDYLTKPIDIDLLQIALAQWSDDHHFPQGSNVTPAAHHTAQLQPKAQLTGAAPCGLPRHSKAQNNVWDFQGALKRVRGKPERLLKLAQRFQASSDGMLSDVRDGAAAKNGRQFADACHALKGVAANMGADKLSSMAAELEYLGKTGELAKACERLAILEADTHEFIAVLKRFENDPAAFGDAI